MNWQPIETAPKDRTEVLCWREDCGPFIASYTSADGFPLTQAEIDSMDEESLFHMDWFTQWPQAVRLDGGEAPTHWMPLPAAPGEKCRTCNGHGAVGNILAAEPCQDCTPAPAAPVGWTDDQMIRFASQILRHGATSDSIEQRLGRFRGDEEFRGLDTPKAAFAVTAAAKESP